MVLNLFTGFLAHGVHGAEDASQNSVSLFDALNVRAGVCLHMFDQIGYQVLSAHLLNTVKHDHGNRLILKWAYPR